MRSASARSKASSTSPESPFSAICAMSGRLTPLARSPELPVCETNSRVSPASSRFAGRANARQRSGATHLIKLNATFARTAPRTRTPSSAAGITRVSLNTRASPGASRSGKSRTVKSIVPFPPATSSRALSRGVTGLSAIRSCGSSKSKRSVRKGGGPSRAKGSAPATTRFAPGASLVAVGITGQDALRRLKIGGSIRP